MAVQQQAAGAKSRAGTQVRAWLDDPGPPDAPNTPVEHPVPNIAAKPFPSTIGGRAPAAGDYAPGTAKFRYWTAADALRRVGDLWGQVLGSNVKWHSTVGAKLKVTLNAGEDLNAYYDRSGLHFFHGRPAAMTSSRARAPTSSATSSATRSSTRSGRSSSTPDARAAGLPRVLRRHERHAHGAAADEFHRGDQRDARASSTAPRASRGWPSSSGWAIRQATRTPSIATACATPSTRSSTGIPQTLPPRLRRRQLSSEPHSFSRVFTALPHVLAGMFAPSRRATATPSWTSTRTPRNCSSTAIRQAPVVVDYFSQVAAHMLTAEQTRFGGRYQDALRSAFVRHGVLALAARGHGTALGGGARRQGACGHRGEPPAGGDLRRPVRLRRGAPRPSGG